MNQVGANVVDEELISIVVVLVPACLRCPLPGGGSTVYGKHGRGVGADKIPTVDKIIMMKNN